MELARFLEKLARFLEKLARFLESDNGDPLLRFGSGIQQSGRLRAKRLLGTTIGSAGRGFSLAVKAVVSGTWPAAASLPVSKGMRERSSRAAGLDARTGKLAAPLVPLGGHLIGC